MSLRKRLREADRRGGEESPAARFGVLANPFPTSNRTSGNPRCETEADEEAEARIVTFLRNGKSQVVVVEGAQGVGKTNFLNHFESEIRDALDEREGHYVVRYLADPEASFEGTTRRLFEEMGTGRLRRLARKLGKDPSPIETARGHDIRTALHHLRRRYRSGDDGMDGVLDLMMQWLLGLRLLKSHRQNLGVQFRLDTVESKTVALRDLAQVSGEAGVLDGIFLLLDELEKQDGVLGRVAVARYLSALRAVVDALPRQLFLMIAITPDALLRYSHALPALRSRLQNRIVLEPLKEVDEALDLADFYLDAARRRAREGTRQEALGDGPILKRSRMEKCYRKLEGLAERRGDTGVRQREFLHELHVLAEEAIRRPSPRQRR